MHYQNMRMKRNRIVRICIGVLCVLGLISVFIFQRVDVSQWLGLQLLPIWKFIFNRTVRFLLNDFLAIGVIYALFAERKYVAFAFAVQLTGMILFLLPYFILKFHFPHYNGPLISYLHRLIMNPTLMLLLIPAFYYQKMKQA